VVCWHERLLGPDQAVAGVLDGKVVLGLCRAALGGVVLSALRAVLVQFHFSGSMRSSVAPPVRLGGPVTLLWDFFAR